MALTEEMVRRAQREDLDSWRISNQALYDLCKKYRCHNNDAEIVAKVMLIGHAYSADLERGRGDVVGADVSNDKFYTKYVAPKLKASELDKKLDALQKMNEVDESNVAELLDTHGYLVGLFYELTQMRKRSLASKYLHFHLPNLFFILDSRATSSIRSLPGAKQSIKSPPTTADAEYTKFVGAALGLREHVSSEFGKRLTPRQLDRLLLETFASGDA